MKKLLLFLTLLLPVCAFAQKKALDPNKKRVNAMRTEEKLVLDGRLDDAVWQQAEVATDFTVFQPTPGATPSHRTEVRIIYDNVAVYIGAMMYDSEPDSISRELSQRDNIGNTDWFLVGFDPYLSGRDGFEFLVTPENVQFDAKVINNNEDTNWDAVWDSRAVTLENGWSLEMKIPYSALRFPDVPEQQWGMTFARLINRSQEKSFWNPLDPEVAGYVPQWGYLLNLNNVKSPTRLQATPFLAVYGQKYSDPEGENSSAHSFNGGMDVKVGLSDAFTLDMTLIPDFGEARSDDQVLNLSPFEVRFDEQRAFFTEGTELFDKANLFYSRRVGGAPVDLYAVYDQLEEGEEVIENPNKSQLYNATKISGRTAKGLGIGFFNATSGRTFAKIRNSEGGEREFQTDPLTNYNVFVLDQNLPHNSSASFINTTVLREGAYYDANVTGAFTRLRNKANSWSFEGGYIMSQLYQPESTELGHKYFIEIDKTGGNLNFGIDYGVETDTYNPRDLGFLNNNNEQELSGYIEYNKYEPFGIFNNAGFGLYTEYERLYKPSAFTQFGVNVFGYGQLKNFWRVNIWSYVSPVDSYDYFEPRTAGRYWRDAPSGNAGFFVRTDSRKRLQLTMNANYWTSEQKDRDNLFLRVGPSYRVSDRLNFRMNVSRSLGKNSIGFVNNYTHQVLDPVSGEMIDRTDIIFGKRDRETIELSFSGNYNFSSRMALNLRLRHYWSKVAYNEFRLLDEEGYLRDTDYYDLHDGDFDAFNVDLIYRWRFAPGSDIFIVWKNSLFSFEEEVSANYFSNLNKLWNNPQTNQLSFKIVYFLDYATLRGNGL